MLHPEAKPRIPYVSQCLEKGTGPVVAATDYIKTFADQIRRMADFQNLVFRTYARKHGLTYLPMDEAFPHDPDLFGDAIHMTQRGLRLRARHRLRAGFSAGAR